MSTIKTDNITWKSGEAGGQPQYTVTADKVILGTAKSWVNFNGTGTIATRASFNVSSLTDNGTGDYTINFVNAILDSGYSFSNASQYSGSGSSAKQNIWTNVPDGSNNISASSLRLTPISSTATSYDSFAVVATIHR